MAATLGRLLIAAAPSIAAGWALGAGFTTRSQQTASTGARVDLSMAEGGHFEYLVLGGGSGGIASARRAAAHGAKVGVIERARLGGTCVNVGCVPKKVMFNAGSMQQFFHQAAGYGFELGSVDFKWSALKSKRDAYVKRLNGIYERNLDNSGVEFIVGDAKFTGAKEVTVGDKTYTADTILIAVGGKPVLPDVPGIEHAIESDGFFELEELPGKVAVIGSGYIAVELAGILKLLGAEACRAVLSPQPHSWSCEPTPPLLIHTTIVADSGFSPGPSPRLAVLHPQRTSSLPSLLFDPSSSIPPLPSLLFHPQVDLLIRGDRPLKTMDSSVTDMLVAEMKEEGVNFVKVRALHTHGPTHATPCSSPLAALHPSFLAPYPCTVPLAAFTLLPLLAPPYF